MYDTRVMRFEGVSPAVEGPTPKVAFTLAAAVALFAAAPAEAVPASAAQEYASVVRSIQSEADASFGRGRVIVMDRSAPSATEAVRIARATGWLQGDTDQFTRWAPMSTEGNRGREGVCLVVGEDPSRSAADVFALEDSVVPKTGDVGYADAHRWAIMSALSGCEVIGFRDQRRTVFAILAAGTRSASRDFPGLAARYVELADTLEPSPPDERSRGHAAVGAARLLQSGKAPRELKAIAALAKKMVSDRSPTPPKDGFVDRLRNGALGAAFWVPVNEGAVVTARTGWIAAYAGTSPSFGRLAGMVADFVAGRFRGVQKDAVPDESWRVAMREGAARGDSTAADMIGAKTGSAFVLVTDRPAGSVPGRLVRFDRANARLVTEEYGTVYSVVAADGTELASGNYEQETRPLLQRDDPDPEAPRTPSP